MKKKKLNGFQTKQRNQQMIKNELESKNTDSLSEKENPYGIKTPTSVEEFRENLKKYYVTIPRGVNNKKYPNRMDVPIENLYLYVREQEIPLTDINSFGDIYKITKTGFSKGGNGSSPSILPMITVVKELKDYMKKTEQILSSDGYFYDESNYKLWDDVDEFLKSDNPRWTTLDNQWLREFYMMTLGDFSGYVYKNTETEEVS